MLKFENYWIRCFSHLWLKNDKFILLFKMKKDMVSALNELEWFSLFDYTVESLENFEKLNYFLNTQENLQRFLFNWNLAPDLCLAPSVILKCS